MTDSRTFRPVLLAAAAALFAAALLAGCSARGAGRGFEERTVAPAPLQAQSAPADQVELDKAAVPGRGGEAASDGAPATEGSAGGTLSNLPDTAADARRMVIKTATLAVRVRDVTSAFQRAVQLADGSGGYVQTSTQSEEGGDRADLTIRVPPNGFLPLIASLGALGTVTTKTVSGEDVTEEYYDLGAELDNQVEVRGRLLQLLKQSVKVSDAISVEEQLERVGANVNRIKGRMKYLSEMTGLSTVNVSLYGEERASGGAEGFINWSFIGHGFWRAAQILVQAFFVLLQVLVVAIPLAAVGGAVAWGVIVLVRRIRKWRRAATPAPRRPAR